MIQTQRYGQHCMGVTKRNNQIKYQVVTSELVSYKTDKMTRHAHLLDLRAQLDELQLNKSILHSHVYRFCLSYLSKILLINLICSS